MLGFHVGSACLPCFTKGKKKSFKSEFFMVVGEALWRTEKECLWLEILLCCGSWWASERSWSSCNKRFLQSIQHKSRQGEEAGAGLCWVSWSLKSHFSVCVCVCAAGGQGMWELEPLGCVSGRSLLLQSMGLSFHGHSTAVPGSREDRGCHKKCSELSDLGWWGSFPPFAVENRRFPNLSALP